MKPSRSLNISTAELAKICGVSQGTVDRALNDRSDIKKETKDKILSAAKLFGYRRPAESSPLDKITGQVGIIVFNLNNDYFSELVMNAESILTERGFSTVVMMTHYDASLEVECIRKMYNMGVSGIILCSVNSGEEFCQYLDMFDIPIVAVGNDIGGVPYSGIDDFTAMRDMTQSVLADGYENLIYYSPALKYKTAFAQQRRFAGFLTASDGVPHTAISDISEIKPFYDGKTAIICSTDFYAFDVYTKAKNAKVTGFDNLKIIEKLGLDIDSVAYSGREIAEKAVDIIFSGKKSSIIVNHTIIKR